MNYVWESMVMVGMIIAVIVLIVAVLINTTNSIDG